MTNSRRSRLGAGLAIASLLAVGGAAGCGKAGGDAGGRTTARPDAVVVTYYYLPG